MERPASEVYEIVLEETDRKRRFFGWIGVLFANFMSAGAGPANPGGRILSVRNLDTGTELFRHIEDFGDEGADLLGALERDLDTMSVDDFEREWSAG